MHSLRDCDFKLYYALDELCRWFLAFDYTNFSRWLLIHVNDLGMWFSVHKHTGIFVAQQSIYTFYLMAKDQSHQNSNRQLQAVGGGLSDLYDDTDFNAFYMPAAPDSVIFNNEFESVQNHRNSDVHHKESL